jgi:hypothetical protein
MGMDKRRSERLTGRFVVVVREKLATWVTTTEDVSARGCRIELKRPLTPGMLIQLVFELGEGQDPLVAHGQVTWARRTPPHSAGIAFLTTPRQAKEGPGKAGDWIDRLLAAYVRRIGEGSARPAETPAPASRPAPAAEPPRAVAGIRVRPSVIIPPTP